MSNSLYDLLELCFEDKEIPNRYSLKKYKIYCISDEYDIYHIYNNTEIDFKIVGCLIFNEELSLIRTICVHPNFRRKNFGKILLTFIKEDNNLLNLHVRESNNSAISLYKKFGFKIVEKIENYYSYTENNEDGYHMQYSIV